MEPPKRLGNLWLCKTTSDGSSELVDLDILVSKLSSRGIEDRRNAVGVGYCGLCGRIASC